MGLLSNKTSIITGSNRGIGLSLVHVFAKEGSDIIACARKEDQHFLSKIQSISKEYNINIYPIFFDFNDEESMKNASREILKAHKTIDVLVNNAGIAHGGIFQMSPIQIIKDIFEVNFFSQLAFTQTLIRPMIKKGGGSIVNIGSTSGLIGDKGTIAYGSSKASLMFATKVLAQELGPFNIRVNTVAPGLVKTDMFEEMDKKVSDDYIESSALGRPGEPHEIANVVAFVSSENASFITGEVIRVDGGLNR